ncbi:MAG: 3-deoxy-D-manno-octulosonic acid transferase [Rhodospirillales bacterium]|nr:3-deoxy-D-manno-octulosonic acid transferase [Rhodospirillales bacterium]
MYRALTLVAGPAVSLYLDIRLKRGKEDPIRLGERFGYPGKLRPEGFLVWVHAASVGEAVSALPLIEKLKQDSPELELLMTTGTVSSARIMSERLPEGVIHQFMPVDLLRAVERFLDHWKPDLALWIESEFWPSLVTATSARDVPMVLVNASLSDKSFRSWRRFPGMAGTLLAGFRASLAQSEAVAIRLSALGAGNVKSTGNLKYAAPPLPANAKAVAELEGSLNGRPRWFAASTHPGEEEIVARVHLALKQGLPDLITMIAPRHPDRGSSIARLLAGMGLEVARRSEGGVITSSTDIYLADTLGELGVLYRNTKISFMGGSFIPHGGQNPLEPARLGCAILHGPHMFNFQAPVGDLLAAGASKTVADEGELAGAVKTLLQDADLVRARAAAALRVGSDAGGVLDEVMAEVRRHLPGPET